MKEKGCLDNIAQAEGETFKWEFVACELRETRPVTVPHRVVSQQLEEWTNFPQGVHALYELCVSRELHQTLW